MTIGTDDDAFCVDDNQLTVTAAGLEIIPRGYQYGQTMPPAECARLGLRLLLRFGYHLMPDEREDLCEQLDPE